MALRILEGLAAEPVLTIDTVAERHGVSQTAAHRALTLLADADILSRTKDQRGRLVCWTADRHLALVALTERSNRVGVPRKPALKFSTASNVSLIAIPDRSALSTPRRIG